MKKNNIKITPEFVDNFLSPIANVIDRVPFYINDGKISVNCFNSTGDVEFGLSFSMDVDTDIEDTTINLSDLKKFKNLINKATELQYNDDLILCKNTLKYESIKWRWKYHLLDSDLLSVRKIKKDNIDNFKYNVSFIFKPDILNDIVKIKSLHKNNSDKVYLKIGEDSITSCITDFSSSNTDEIGVVVTDKFESDDEIDQAIIKFDIIKILSQHRGVPFKVKISKQACLFQTVWNGVNISYIISQLRK